MGRVVPRPDDTLERKLRDYERRLAAMERATPTIATTFPDEPFDGQDVYYLASATAGIVWHFRYRAASSSVFKWEAVGRQESLFEEIATSQSTSFVGNPFTYTNLTTAGPAVQVPLSGEYRIEHGARVSNSTLAFSLMSYAYSGVNDANDGDAISPALAANEGAHHSRPRHAKALNAGAVVLARYRVTAGTGTFSDRWIDVRPLRVTA